MDFCINLFERSGFKAILGKVSANIQCSLYDRAQMRKVAAEIQHSFLVAVDSKQYYSYGHVMLKGLHKSNLGRPIGSIRVK